MIFCNHFKNLPNILTWTFKVTSLYMINKNIWLVQKKPTIFNWECKSKRVVHLKILTESINKHFQCDYNILSYYWLFFLSTIIRTFYIYQQCHLRLWSVINCIEFFLVKVGLTVASTGIVWWYGININF